MTISIITQFMRTNTDIHIRAVSGLTIVDPNSEREQFFPEGSVIKAGMEIGFNEEGYYSKKFEGEIKSEGSIAEISEAINGMFNSFSMGLDPNRGDNHCVFSSDTQFMSDDDMHDFVVSFDENGNICIEEKEAAIEHPLHNNPEGPRDLNIEEQNIFLEMHQILIMYRKI